MALIHSPLPPKNIYYPKKRDAEIYRSEQIKKILRREREREKSIDYGGKVQAD